MIDHDLRERILTAPQSFLADPEIMRALIAANDDNLDENIIDLRSLAVERLSQRLGELENAHRNVIIAAHDNLAGTNRLHRAILQMLDAGSFEDLLTALEQEVGPTLRLDCLRLVLETDPNDAFKDEDLAALAKHDKVLILAEPGFIDKYIAAGRKTSLRKVTLRSAIAASSQLYQGQEISIGSEALLALNFGTGHPPGLLVMGATENSHFKPSQGTDLLEFFAQTFERVMLRWLP